MPTRDEDSDETLGAYDVESHAMPSTTEDEEIVAQLLALLATTDVHICRGAGRRAHRLILPAGGEIGELRAHLRTTLERALRD